MFKKPRQIGRSNPTAHKRQVTARLKVVITPAHRYRSLFRNADPLGGLALSEYSAEQQPGDVTESGQEGPSTTGTQPQPTASTSTEGSRGVRWLDREVRSGKVAKEKLLGGEGGTPPPQRTDRILRSYSMAAPRFVLLHSFRVQHSRPYDKAMFRTHIHSTWTKRSRALYHTGPCLQHTCMHLMRT